MSNSNKLELVTDAQKFAPKYYTDNNLIRPCNRVLTAVELAAIFTTPIELVADPGAGKIIVPVGNINVLMDYNSAAWSTYDYLYFGYSGGNNFLQLDMAGYNSTVDQHTICPIVKTVGAANTKLVVFSPTNNWASGNSPIRILFNYQVIDI